MSRRLAVGCSNRKTKNEFGIIDVIRITDNCVNSTKFNNIIHYNFTFIEGFIHKLVVSKVVNKKRWFSYWSSHLKLTWPITQFQKNWMATTTFKRKCSLNICIEMGLFNFIKTPFRHAFTKLYECKECKFNANGNNYHLYSLPKWFSGTGNGSASTSND